VNLYAWRKRTTTPSTPAKDEDGELQNAACLRQALFKPLKHVFLAYCNTATGVLPPAIFLGGILESQATSDSSISIMVFPSLFPHFWRRLQDLFISTYGYSNDWLEAGNRYAMRPHELVAFCCDGRSPRLAFTVEAISSMRIVDPAAAGNTEEAAAVDDDPWNFAKLKYFAEHDEFRIVFKIFQAALDETQRRELLFGDEEKWGQTWNLPQAFDAFVPPEGAGKPWFQADEEFMSWFRSA